MENHEFLHKLAKLRSAAWAARDSAKGACEWWWVGYLNALLAETDAAMERAAREAAATQLFSAAQLELVDRDADQAS